MGNKLEIVRPHLEGAIVLLEVALFKNDPHYLLRAQFKLLDAKELLQ